MLPIRNVLTSLRIQEEKKSNGYEKIHELRVTFEPYGAREDRYIIIVRVKDGLRRNKYTHTTYTHTRARSISTAPGSAVTIIYTQNILGVSPYLSSTPKFKT